MNGAETPIVESGLPLWQWLVGVSVGLLGIGVALLTWLVERETALRFLQVSWERIRSIGRFTISGRSGARRNEHAIPSFGEPISDAEVFVNWVGSRESHDVYTAARKAEGDRDGWPQMQEHCGSPFFARFEWQNTTEEYCTLRFVDGSEVICHIRTNDAESGLKPVQVRGVDIDRADAVRREMESNAMAAAFAETVMESPGAHIDVGTGETKWIEPPKALKSEGGKLTLKRSALWDWRAAWNRRFRKKLRGE